MTRPLYKTKIVIWSEYDPTQVELDDLARDAVSGESYCSSSSSEVIQDPTIDPDWDNTDFALRKPSSNKERFMRDLGWFLVAVLFLALGASSALEFCLWLIGG